MKQSISKPTHSDASPNDETQLREDQGGALAQTLMARLQSQLLNLAVTDDDISPQDIERAAKAISQLVRGLQDAESFLALRTADDQYGLRPKDETREAFLSKLKRIVNSGLLDAVDE